MLKFPALALCFTLTGGLACGSDDDQGGAGAGGGAGMAGNAPVAFADVKGIMRISCALSTSCHKGRSPKAGLNLEDDQAYAALMGADGTGQASCEFPERKIVIPGDPGASFLMEKLTTMPTAMPAAECTSADGKNERMPSGDPPLPEDKISLFREWIAAGAKND